MTDRKADSAFPWLAVLSGLVLHYIAYGIMQTLCLIAETKRGPSLSDRLHDIIPANRGLDVFNSVIWLPGILIFILVLILFRSTAAVNYLRIGAVVSVLRGIFVYCTSLGPPEALLKTATPEMLTLKLSDLTAPLLFRQWVPFDVFYGGSGLSAAYLTQDLFFSGHTATTFLFLVVLKGRDWLRIPALLFHCITVSLLVVTHEHYTIDILGAYFIVYAVYSFFEKRRYLFAQEEARV